MMDLHAAIDMDNFDQVKDMAEQMMKKKSERKSKSRSRSSKKKLSKSGKSSKSIHSAPSSVSAASSPSTTASKKKSCTIKQSNVPSSGDGIDSSSHPVESIPLNNTDNMSVVSDMGDDEGFPSSRRPSTNSVSSDQSTAYSDLPKATVMPAFQESHAVDRTWEQIKGMDDYQDNFGEQIVFRMMEADPNARKELGVTSLRSARFGEISQTLVVVVDLIVNFMGPDIEDFLTEMENLGQECEKQGIRVCLLANAVSGAVKSMLGDDKFDDADENAWICVVEYAAIKMKTTQQQS